MPTVFERIAKGEISSHKVWEDERYFAFLDINPLVAGHTLVIPKQPTDYLFDLDDEAYAGLWGAVRVVAGKIKRATGARRVLVHVEGFEVSHAHVHLLPANNGIFPLPDTDKAAQANLADTARRIAQA